jgi:hypothetical protein
VLIEKEQFRDGLVGAYFVAQLRRYTRRWMAGALLSALFCLAISLVILLTLPALNLLWTLPSWLGVGVVTGLAVWMRLTDQADYGHNWALFYDDHGHYGRHSLRHVQRDSSRHRHRMLAFKECYDDALAVPDEFPRDELMPAHLSDEAQHRWLENRLVLALDELRLHAPVRYEHRWDAQYGRFESVRIAPLTSTNPANVFNPTKAEIVSPVDTPSQAHIRAQLGADYACFQQQTRFPQDGPDRWLQTAYELVGDHEPDPNEVVAEVTSLGTGTNILLTRADVNPQSEVSYLTLVEQALERALRALHAEQGRQQ